MIAPVLVSIAVVLAAAPWALGLTRRARSLDKPAAPGGIAGRSSIDLAALASRPARWIEARFGGRDDPTARWIGALDRLARATSTGTSLGAALDAEGRRPDAPPTLTELARVRRGGRTVDDAVSRLGPVDDPDGRLAVAVIGVLASSGGPAAAPLDRAAAILRDRRAAAGERTIGAAQARVSAQVLSALPVVVTLWSLLTDPRLRHVLIGTPIGPICLVVGACLDLVGWRWMRRIVSRS